MIVFYSVGWAAVSGNEVHHGDGMMNQSTLVSDSKFRPSHWTLFGGIATGFGSVSGTEFDRSPSGLQYQVTGLISYRPNIDRISQINPIPTSFFGNLVFDLGLGWMYSQLQGSQLQDAAISIRTRMGILELSPRIQLGSHWQLGPFLQYTFGADSTFSSSIGESSHSTFFGLKSVYEFDWNHFPIRAIAQVSTDLSIQRRQLYLGFFGIQLGIPIGSSPDKTQTDSKIELELKNSAVILKTLNIELDPKKVFFATNSAKLKPKVARLLSQVGDYLHDHPDDWESLDIFGHADRRGGYRYNIALSKRRAAAVRKVLSQDLDHSAKVKWDGFGYTRPMDPNQNPKAWSVNRRVELVFHQVAHPEILAEQLKELQ